MSRRSNYPGPIPKRWLNCPRKSHVIDDTFIAIKTPLDMKFSDQVPVANIFTPQIFLGIAKAEKRKIGLWIDLTNTDRFYNSADISSQDIKYVKLGCQGHGVCPSNEQVNTFVRVCRSFKDKHPNDLIVVHCTHGFNRTGFMIASYLIMVLAWSCDLAIKEFANARQPGIYKPDYLREMYSRYDDVHQCPAAPQLPDWYLEDADEEEVEKVNPGSMSRTARNRNEKILYDAKFMDGIPGVTLVTHKDTVMAVRRKMQSFCNWTRSGFPGCQPVSMDQDNKQMLLEKPYKISWKADGTRYMMLIDGHDQVYFADRNNSIFKASLLHFPMKHDLKKPLVDTLVDGEMVIDKADGQTVPRYLIYDAVRIHGRDVINDPFGMRFERIMTDIVLPRNGAIQKGLFTKASEPFSIRRKDFWDLNYKNTYRLLSEEFNKQLAHEPDGLIVQPANEAYIPGPAPSVLKWKPPSHNSVDFKLKVSILKKEGSPPETVYDLFVGKCDRPFDRIKGGKALKKYDGKIIECNVVNDEWRFMRERTDKKFPNSYETAFAVCQSIVNPVTEEILLRMLYERDAQENMQPTKRRRLE